MSEDNWVFETFLKLNATEYWQQFQEIELSAAEQENQIENRRRMVVMYAHLASSILSGFLSQWKETMGLMVLQASLQGILTSIQYQGLMIDAAAAFAKGPKGFAKGIYYSFLANQSMYNYMQTIYAKGQAQVAKQMTIKIKNYKEMYR